MIGQSALDRYTLAHLLVGAGMGVLRISPITALAITTTWELVEDPLLGRKSESLKNKLVDVVANLVGYYAGRKFSNGT